MTRLKSPPEEPAVPAVEAAAPALVKREIPRGGGRYIRQTDGSLKKVEA